MKVGGEECNSEIIEKEIIFKNVNVVKVLKFVKVYREDDDSKAMQCCLVVGGSIEMKRKRRKGRRILRKTEDVDKEDEEMRERAKEDEDLKVSMAK